MAARMLGSKGVEIMRSHIGWRGKRVLAKTLGPKEGGLRDPTLVEKRNETFFIRV